MKQFKIVWILALLLALGAFDRLGARAADGADYYVSPEGKDAWSGRLPAPNAGATDGPFATLVRARDAVREQLAKGPGKDWLVQIAAGRYELEAPLVFTEEDSGAGRFTVTYAAAAGARPVLSGGHRIQGQWTKGKNDIWSIELPQVREGWWFRDLFAGDARLTRARFPNEGEFAIVKEVKFDESAKLPPDLPIVTLDRPLPVDGLTGQDAELVALHIWSSGRARIHDVAGNVIHPEGNQTLGWKGHPWTSLSVFGMERRVWVEHALALLDQPGEWYLDRDAARLYFMPAAGQDPNQMEFFAPNATQLLIVSGRKYHPARNLQFRGLALEHANWNLPLAGYNGVQATNYGTAYGTEPCFGLTPAVYFEYAEDCAFTGGRLAHTGAGGFALGAGCRRNRLLGNEFFDIGGNAVMVGWCARADDPPRHIMENDWSDPQDAPAGNDVSHNHIHECAAVQFGGVGIYVAFSPDTRITHNHIENQPYSGISDGYIWGDTPTTQRRNTIAYNHIHDVMQLLHDGGGIYMLGYQPGTVLDHNLIHDVPGGHGIYTDEGSSQMLIEKNVVYRVGGGGYHHHYGHHNTVRNNVFASSGQAAVVRARGDAELSFTFERNIVWMDRGEFVVTGNMANNLVGFDNNLYWDARGQAPAFRLIPNGAPGQNDLAAWRARGQDVHSQVADPLFADFAKGNFNLRAESPALKLGFEPIDLSQVGPQGEYAVKP